MKSIKFLSIIGILHLSSIEAFNSIHPTAFFKKNAAKSTTSSTSSRSSSKFNSISQRGPVVYGQETKRQDNNNLEPEVKHIFDADLAKVVIQELWYLPALSVLSGFSPACRIIAESHLSRMPDTPIAHDIDTFLLWPAIGNPADRNLPPTILQTPAAAITNESQYDVDWDAVSTAFFTNVGTSLIYASILGLTLYIYLITGRSSSHDCEEEAH
jgi:hypothetical protein